MNKFDGYMEKTMNNSVEVERLCAEARDVRDGLKNMKAGRTVDGPAAISGLREKYGL